MGEMTTLAEDFDAVVSRVGTFATKWDRMRTDFGTTDAIPMWVADMDFPAAPAIRAAVADRAAHPFYGYTTEPPDYRGVVAGWLARRSGWRPEADWIVHSNGVLPGIAFSLQAFTNPGDTVLAFEPSYPPFRRMTVGQGREFLTVPLVPDDATGSLRIDLDQVARVLASRPVKVCIMCSPHNPTGRVWTREELAALDELLARHDVLVLSDEIHSDLIYPGHHHTPYPSVSESAAARSVTFVAPSKTFGTAGLQTAVVIIPNDEMRARFRDMEAAFGDTEMNPFGLASLIAAWTSCDSWVDDVMRYLEETRDFVLEELRRRIPAIRPIKPEGTYLLWLDCSKLGLGDPEMSEFFARVAGVALTPGAPFGVTGTGHMRMNLALPRPLVRQALDQIERAVASLPSR